MNFPGNLRYTKEHEWVLIASDTVVVIGITDYAQSELGELVYVEVETVDETLAKGETFGTVEAVKTTSDLFMPVSGKIIEFNSELNENEGDNPTLVNDAPYEEGWIIKIEISDPSELDDLMDAREYEALVA